MMIGLILLILFLPVLFAPFETAGWWTQHRQRQEILPARPPKAAHGIKAQLVYFTGVAGYSGEFLARREEALLKRIGESFPELAIHSEIFPYSFNCIIPFSILPNAHRFCATQIVTKYAPPCV